MLLSAYPDTGVSQAASACKRFETYRLRTLEASKPIKFLREAKSHFHNLFRLDRCSGQKKKTLQNAFPARSCLPILSRAGQGGLRPGLRITHQLPLIVGRSLSMLADPGEFRKDRIAIEFDRSLPHGFLFFEDDFGNRRNHKPMVIDNLLLELGLCPSCMADKPPEVLG